MQANHELQTGDVLIDNERGEELEVVVNDDGSVALDGEEFSEREICASLRDGVLTREDGKDHELVKSF